MTFKELLKQQNYTQRKLSAFINVSQPCISNWVNGVNIPSKENMMKIADALKVNTILVIQCFYN